jgi:lipoprotein LprG
MSLRRAGTWLVAVVLLAVPILAGCSGGSGGSGESASALLARAKTTLDQARTVHFVLDSTNPPTTGTALLGGTGDFLRPSSFQGTLQVLTGGNTVGLKVISVAGTVYVQLPFVPTYSAVDPHQFGLGDPGALLDPETGISQLLAKADNAKAGDEKRVNGEVVREVTADLPGDLVQQLLTSKDPATPVQARFSIATGSGQLRRAVLTGPFFSAESNATYTIELSDFGADVSISAPPT